MNYIERLQNVAILGAAGKMGSGITLLTVVEMMDQSLITENRGKTFVLHAIDVSYAVLDGLMNYLKVQVQKIAEKKIVALRNAYRDRADLIENSEIIDEYVANTLLLVKPGTSPEPAYSSLLVFEAIKEDPELKVKLFSLIDQNNFNKPWFLTNTSSIPIGKLNQEANLKGRIIGFHFYNPPAVQKLVELIKAKETKVELEEFSLMFAKRIRKVVVPSNDVAGFIGNGHFMRDALYALQLVEKLKADYSFTQAVYLINKITQEYLIRPMGIFQLIDYVGIDVCQYILSVMQVFIKDEKLHSPTLDLLISQSVKGGQYANGSQKDGILKYDKGKAIAVYNIDTKNYQSIEEFRALIDNTLGALPDNMLPWKEVIAIKQKENYLTNYFSGMSNLKTLGAKLAVDYHLNSKEVAEKLVSSGVAQSAKDVNTVLMTGFFHAYGPVNDFI